MDLDHPRTPADPETGTVGEREGPVEAVLARRGVEEGAHADVRTP